jgi:hypothetical protein
MNAVNTAMSLEEGGTIVFRPNMHSSARLVVTKEGAKENPRQSECWYIEYIGPDNLHFSRVRELPMHVGVKDDLADILRSLFDSLERDVERHLSASYSASVVTNHMDILFC